MPFDARPVPSPQGPSGAEIVRRMLAADRIAIVGLSDDPSRPSFGIARYLIAAGKTILPVNPMAGSVLGLKSYKALSDVPAPIDLVNVFRRAEFCPDVVREAVAAGAKGVWLQSGVVSEEARQIALAAGLDFVQNRCIMVEHMHVGT